MTAVYYLFDADVLVYVGRSDNPQRRRSHFERKHGFPVSMLIECFPTFEAAQIAERSAIAFYRPEFNHKVMSARGMQGHKHTVETKAKIAAGNRGKVYSAETRAKIGAAQKGRKHEAMSAETRRKLSEANRGRKFTAEHRANIGAAMKGKRGSRTGQPVSQETRQRMSISAKRRCGVLV